MLQKHIKNSIYNKNVKGSKSARTPYSIRTTMQERNRYANNRFQLELKEQVNYTVDDIIMEDIVNELNRLKISKQRIALLGVNKCLQIVNMIKSKRTSFYSKGGSKKDFNNLSLTEISKM